MVYLPKFFFKLDNKITIKIFFISIIFLNVKIKFIEKKSI